MGLEEILKNIELETKAKTKQIANAADAEIRKIEEEGQAAVAGHRKSARIKAEADAKQLLTRELSRANTEAKGIYQNAVNNYINDSMTSLNDNIGSYLESQEYQKLLNTLAGMVTQELGQGCTIAVQKRDVPKLKQIKDVKVIEAKEKFLGGVRATSNDGKRYMDYSIEKIIESLRDSIAVGLLKMIKEES